jgi:hypothetical protein
MDYVALDLRTFFTPSEAAMAWCEITNVSAQNQHNYQHVLHEISEAIRLEELPAQIPVTHHDDWITEQTRTKRHPDRAKIAREDLKRWAEARGIKPKFLFSETRDIQPVTAITETAPIVEQALISNSQQRFAAWRKQAKEIWDEHVNYTQDQVAHIIREDTIAKKKGVYSVKTIVRYISAVDPRTNRVGRRKLETID